MLAILKSKSFKKLLILVGIATFLIVVSSCAHTFGHVHHDDPSGSVVCDTLAQLSNSVIVKEGMGLALLLLFLATVSVVSLPFSSQLKLHERLFLLYKIPIFKRFFYRIYNPILEALRRGIIHPKLYNATVS